MSESLHCMHFFLPEPVFIPAAIGRGMGEDVVDDFVVRLWSTLCDFRRLRQDFAPSHSLQGHVNRMIDA